jgi:hypothetical protein
MGGALCLMVKGAVSMIFYGKQRVFALRKGLFKIKRPAAYYNN